MRLVTFGCSYTFGHGLSDCWANNDVGPNPSKLSWPSLLADHMNVECINNSRPGSSNKRIWHTVLNTSFKHDDVVFIQWSYPARTCKFKVYDIEDIGPWQKEKYEHLDPFDLLVESKLVIHHTNLYLQSKGIKVYNLVIADSELEMLELYGNTVDHIPIYISPTYKKKIYPKALDGEHPGEEFHAHYAKQLFDFVNERKMQV